VSKGPGSMTVTLMPNGGDFLGEGVGESFDGRFRGGVAAGRGEGGEAEQAGQHDDVAAALIAQVGQRRLGHPERAEHVGVELGADVLFAELLNHSVQADAGVVDDDVQAPEPLVGPLYGRGHGGLVRDIQRQRQDLVAVRGDQIGQGIGVAGGRCDLVAARQCRIGEPAAEATGGTCDEPDLAHGSTL
jgi:hypothetical protein